jgi:nitrite reductase/ring-hydroxylating ferredoxin subunit
MVEKPPIPPETAGSPPEWCDLACPWAAFPPSDALDGSLSCRTFQALLCRRTGRIVAKNARCPHHRADNPDSGKP